MVTEAQKGLRKLQDLADSSQEETRKQGWGEQVSEQLASCPCGGVLESELVPGVKERTLTK